MELSVVRVHKAHSPSGRPGQRARLIVQPEKYLSQCPFILLAEDWFSPQGGFPTHPHEGIVTVTLVLNGSVKHLNDAGVQLHLDKGDAGFVTAGGGVLHGEMAGPQGAHVLRLWLNPPSALKSTQARYECLRLARVQSQALDGGTALVYAGKVDDISAPFMSVWPLTLVNLRLRPEARFAMPLPSGERSFAYVLDGEVELGRNHVGLGRGHVAWIERGLANSHSHDTVPIRATKEARVLIYATPVTDEPMTMCGNIAKNCRADFDKAYADLRTRQTAARATAQRRRDIG